MAIRKVVKKVASGKKSPAKKTRAPKAAKKNQDILSDPDVFVMIQKKAYDLYLQRGCTHGDDQMDWYEAEAAVRACMTRGK